MVATDNMGSGPEGVDHPASALTRDVISRFRAGASLRQLASVTGLSRHRIRKMLVGVGERIRYHHAAALPRDACWWNDQFTTGRSVSDIARDLSTNDMHVYRHLRALGVPPPRSQPIDTWLATRTQVDGACLRWMKKSASSVPVAAFRGSSGRPVRRIVWESAHGPIPSGTWITRTPDCKNLDCVALAHLQAVEPQTSIAERVDARRFRWGEEHGNAKLSEQEARSILADRASGSEDLAARYGVSKSTIYAIWSGRRWGHLNPEGDGEGESEQPG